MTDNPAPTTEISIPGSNEVLIDVLRAQYGHLDPGEARAALEAAYETVWNEEEFAAHFTVEEFHAPYVTAVNNHTGKRGTAVFLDSPRFYFLFKPLEESSSSSA